MQKSRLIGRAAMLALGSFLGLTLGVVTRMIPTSFAGDAPVAANGGLVFGPLDPVFAAEVGDVVEFDVRATCDGKPTRVWIHNRAPAGATFANGHFRWQVARAGVDLNELYSVLFISSDGAGHVNKRACVIVVK